jgi:hypothetical protein
MVFAVIFVVGFGTAWSLEGFDSAEWLTDDGMRTARLRRRGHIHMDIVKHLKYLRIKLSQQATPGDL